MRLPLNTAGETPYVDPRQPVLGSLSYQSRGYELQSTISDFSGANQSFVGKYPEDDNRPDYCTATCRVVGAAAFVLVVLGFAGGLQYLSPSLGSQGKSPGAREVSFHARHVPRDPMSLTLPPPPLVALPTATTASPPRRTTTKRATTTKNRAQKHAKSGNITIVYSKEAKETSKKTEDSTSSKENPGFWCSWLYMGCPAAADESSEASLRPEEKGQSDFQEDHGSLEYVQPYEASALEDTMPATPEIQLVATTSTTRAPITEQAIQNAINMETEAEHLRYGDTSDAYVSLKKSVEHEPTLTDCKYPRYQVVSKCVCPTGTSWNGEWCIKDEHPKQMTFYMYRAQGNADYPMANINMADLTGVMFYLHNEIVKYNTTPKTRVNGITRILRFLVTVTPASQLVKRKLPFMPFVAFDSGRCSVPGCNSLWQDFGYSVGCQEQKGAGYGYEPPAYWRDAGGVQEGAWFSLPGSCPEKPMGHKDGECLARYPGGSCSTRPGSSGCTFSANFAGEVFLDELENIKDFKSWREAGHREYDADKDKGIGTVFWNYRKSKTWCDRRMQRVRSLFKQKYPELPNDLPRPACQ